MTAPVYIGDLSRAEQDVLSWAAHNAKFGWSLTTSRTYRLTTVKALIAKGLVVHVGDVVMVDADGYTKQPERYRDGFELTDRGRAVLATSGEP